MNFSSARTFIQYRFANVFQYRLREMLGRTPPVDPTIRIFALDDVTFSFIGGPKLGLEDWSKVLANMARKKPRAILIDSLFSVAKEEDDEKKHLKAIQEIPVPIYTGAFLKPRKIRNRYIIPPDRPNQDAKTYISENGVSPLELDYLIPADNWYVYGHSEKYAHIFRGQGQLQVNNEDWTIPLFFRLGPDKVMPHLSLGAANKVEFRRDALYVDDHQVPLDSMAHATIDHRPPIAFYKNTRSLFYPLQRAYVGEEETGVKEGDIVLILDTFATGNTDFHEGGPFGEIPGGFIQAAAIDTILNHRWISKYEVDTLLLVAFICAGIACGYLAGPIKFWVITLVGVFGYSSWVTYMFAYHSVFVPWMLPLAGFFGCGAIVNSYRFLQSQMHRVLIERNLFEEKTLRLEEEKQKVALQESLALGKAVQDLLMPAKQDGDFSGYTYQTKYSPSQVMSGDWVYVWDYSENERRIFLGDVMGKGPSAAIPVAVIIGALKECEVQEVTTTAAFAKINDRLFGLFNGKITSTVSAIVLIKGRGVKVFNAGGPGWFVGHDRKVEFLPLRSAPLGIFDDLKIVSHDINREDTSLLFAFTDGYLEGARALKRVARYFNDLNRSPTIEDVHEILLRAGEGARLEDDKTLLTVRAA